MAAKFFTGLEVTDPDPECVFGNGETILERKRLTMRPTPSPDHSRKVPVAISLNREAHHNSSRVSSR